MKTKIFCDIAELNLIKKFNKKKIVKGFTTNPSLMRKAGAKDYKSYSKKILKICKYKPVSLEVFADEYIEMKKQAIQINAWAKNVYVKVPVANSKGRFMGRIIKELNNQSIKLNITAVYSAKQTEKILKLINKKTRVIISIFAGRAGDTGKDPVPEFKKSVSLAKETLFLNSGTGSFPVSPALPAKIEIITLVFLLINFKIFSVCLALYTAVILSFILWLFNSLIIRPINLPLEFATGTFT